MGRPAVGEPHRLEQVEGVGAARALTVRPDIGAVTLALLFGLYSMIYGVSEIVLGVQLRRTGRTLHEVLPAAA